MTFEHSFALAYRDMLFYIYSRTVDRYACQYLESHDTLLFNRFKAYNDAIKNDAPHKSIQQLLTSMHLAVEE